MKVADFLDVALKLSSENYYPYPKPNNWPIYNHSESNHQPNIIKNLPACISRRLTDISSDETAIGDAKPTYDKILAHRGFCEVSRGQKRPQRKKKKKKNRGEKYHLAPPSVQPDSFNEQQIPYSDKQALLKELEALESFQHQHAEAELQLYA